MRIGRLLRERSIALLTFGLPPVTGGLKTTPGVKNRIHKLSTYSLTEITGVPTRISYMVPNVVLPKL